MNLWRTGELMMCWRQTQKQRRLSLSLISSCQSGEGAGEARSQGDGTEWGKYVVGLVYLCQFCEFIAIVIYCNVGSQSQYYKISLVTLNIYDVFLNRSQRHLLSLLNSLIYISLYFDALKLKPFK